MSRTIDADEFLSWISEVEDEIRKEKMKDCQPDRYDDGLMAATGIVREYVEKMCGIDEAEGKAVKNTNTRNKWVPCSEKLPEDESYILVSFENFTMPDIARYEEDSEGGAFYPGDDEKSYSSYGLFVNAWMPLPEPYKGE